MSASKTTVRTDVVELPEPQVSGGGKGGGRFLQQLAKWEAQQEQEELRAQQGEGSESLRERILGNYRQATIVPFVGLALVTWITLYLLFASSANQIGIAAASIGLLGLTALAIYLYLSPSFSDTVSGGGDSTFSSTSIPLPPPKPPPRRRSRPKRKPEKCDPTRFYFSTGGFIIGLVNLLGRLLTGSTAGVEEGWVGLAVLAGFTIAFLFPCVWRRKRRKKGQAHHPVGA